MAGSFTTRCALNHISAHWWLTVSRTSFSKAMGSSWNTTRRLSPLHVSHKLWQWPSERFVSLEHPWTKPRLRLEIYASLSSCRVVRVASCWQAAGYAWTPADGPGWRYCLHDQGLVCRQHGWDQVWWENGVQLNEWNTSKWNPENNWGNERMCLFCVCVWNSISDIKMDVAVPQSTGNERAVEVEECACPQGYRGPSCQVHMQISEE